MIAKDRPTTVDQYIASCPRDIQAILKNIRSIVKDVAPATVESISYGMPAYKLNGKNLVYFAAWKSHIGFYALPSGTAAFKKELESYHTAKGSIQFPLDQPMPYDLIRDIVVFRLKEVS